jgi:L-rhamnose mutarotase
MTKMARVCFLLRLDPDKLEAYRNHHAAVWPEMLRALADSGWSNYSLFLNREGTLIGYFETQDVNAALARMATTDVNSRWQALMAEYFLTQRGVDEPATFTEFVEVFNLEQQLAAVEAAPPVEL